ncbi:MAG: hypothetical protein ACJAXJ_000043 [Colwellia sp.]
MPQTLIIVLLMSLLSACSPADNSKTESDVQIPLRPFDLKVGTKFSPLPENPFQAPTLEEIPIVLPQSVDNADAIWGATGRDDEGNIYFGVSTHGIAKRLGNDSRTAYLYQYNPQSKKTTLQSDVLTELKRANIYQEGIGQNKLHSKIYQANDGYLYFSSFDEAGEEEGINPTWGGHLWRKKPHALEWEHILSTEEALIAVNTNGRYVYTLGYWDHVLYQYDTKTANVRRTAVGSVSTHVSRNFLVDEKGHAFVPSLKENDYNEIEVYLNEYDTQLQLIEQYPMPNYQKDKIKHHHGIIGYTRMENGDIFFTTSDGGLYQLQLTAINRQEKLSYKGNIHPDGQAYVPSLFTFTGKDFILGLGSMPEKGFQWIIYDSNSAITVNYKIDFPDWKKPMFYGTLTKDNDGYFYVGGWRATSDGKQYQPSLVKFK